MNAQDLLQGLDVAIVGALAWTAGFAIARVRAERRVAAIRRLRDGDLAFHRTQVAALDRADAKTRDTFATCVERATAGCPRCIGRIRQELARREAERELEREGIAPINAPGGIS